MEVCISNKFSGNANAGAGTTLRASPPWFVTFLFCNKMVLGSPPPAEKPIPAISSSGTRVHSGPFLGDEGNSGASKNHLGPTIRGCFSRQEVGPGNLHL